MTASLKAGGLAMLTKGTVSGVVVTTVVILKPGADTYVDKVGLVYNDSGEQAWLVSGNIYCDGFDKTTGSAMSIKGVALVTDDYLIPLTCDHMKDDEREIHNLPKY